MSETIQLNLIGGTMKLRTLVIVTAATLSLILSACGPANADSTMTDKPTEDARMQDTATADAMMHDTPTPDAMMHDTPTADTMSVKPTEGAMMESPAWFDASLTDVNSGKAFRINDFKGKVVLVETMAQWCPSCKKQQIQVKALLENLGMPADLVTLALDIDPNENADTLKSYTASNGFDWMHAVAPADVAREISNLYGDQFLNATSTPILIVDRTGQAHPLPFGIKSADDLMKAIEPYLNGM
jgi:thiol-disulfide isomerase/thioredoxin